MIKKLLLMSLLLFPQLSYAEKVVAPGYEFSTDKVAHITGEINQEMLYKFSTEMLTTALIPGDRLIIINSPGGEVDTGNTMLRIIETERSLGVRTVCVVLGGASSMAFNILTHCDVRVALPRSHFLVHKVAAGIMYPYDGRLTAKYLRKAAREMDKIDEPFRRANAAAMGLSLKQYDYYADNETMWTDTKLLIMGYLNYIGFVTK
jgi:ATP-dependent protease ClpP protease subunit